MNARRLRSIRRAAVIFCALVALASCSNGPDAGPQTAPTSATPSPTSGVITPGPGCKIPKEKRAPAWVPSRLPLPQGTYFYEERPAKKGFNEGRFVMRTEAAAFGRFVRSKWRAAGIVLSRPDHEPGEVESLFTSPFGVGLFKANDVLCEPRYTRLILIFQA